MPLWTLLLQHYSQCLSDIYIGDGSVTNPKILVVNYNSITVEVEADPGSPTPYLLYRRYYIPEGSNYTMTPIAVSIYAVMLYLIETNQTVLFRKIVTLRMPHTFCVMPPPALSRDLTVKWKWHPGKWGHSVSSVAILFGSTKEIIEEMTRWYLEAYQH